jgi:hypothetical protein
MGIANRELDITEQKDLVECLITNTTVSTDYVLHKAPRAQLLTDALAVAVGLSGSPTSTLKIQRFVVGAGLTTISISGALTHTAIGTSGSQRFSLPATGSSLLQLNAGDFVVATSGGANTGAVQLMIDLVVQNIQDFKAWY